MISPRNLYNSRRLVVVCILLLCCLPSPAAAENFNIVAVLSANLPAYETTIQAFNTSLAHKLSVGGQPASKKAIITKIVLGKDLQKNKLKDQIATHSPAVVIAIGSKALAAVRYLRNIPIIYLLVPKPEAVIGHRQGITGVMMAEMPEKQLEVLISAFPYLKKIGLLYDPGRTGLLVKKAEAYAKKRGLELITIQELHSWEVPRQLQSLKGQIDAFWMLPDSSVITPLTVKSIMMFSLKNRIPVLTFADKYLKQGATLSVALDLTAMGEQGADLAARILNNAKPQHLRALHANKIKVKVNRKAIKKLGIIINPAFIGND